MRRPHSRAAVPQPRLLRLHPLQSVLGPAAYFTDLMHFLKLRHYGGLNLSLHGLLNVARPELKYIDLNCKNSDTPVPTIDLIIEVLEARAHMPLGLVGSPNLNRQTTWTEEDLQVYPEHINPAIYVELAKPTKCYRPFELPFDLHLEDARSYLQVIGTSRVALQDAFEWFGGFEATQIFRVDERLGLSKGQSDLVRDVLDMPSLEERWGFPLGSGTWITEINKVELFMERASLDFPAVQELLRTRMFADETKIVYATPCTLKDAVFRDIANETQPGFDSTQLRHIQRFLRVKRALGWTTAELDAVLHGLGATLVMAGLDTLARFVRLRQRFARLPLGEVLSWFAPLDRHEYVEGEPTYYDQVVRPKIRDAAFTALDGSKLLKDFRGDLLGILKVDESELDAILAVTGLTGDDDLTLENLSKLYRVSSIARAVDLSVDELITLTHYTASLNEGAGPFAGTAIAPVRELIDRAEAVKGSRLSVPALDWFIRNQQKDKFGAGDLDVTRTFIGLITALQQAHTDHEQSLPPPELAKIDRIAKLLALFLSEADTKAAVEFITQVTPVPDDGVAAGLRDQLLFFLVEESPAWLEFGKGSGSWGTVEARVNLILPVVEAYVRQQRLESVVIRQMAVALSLEVADADMLLRKFTHGTPTALAILTDDAFFSTASYSVDADAPLIKNVDFPALFLDRTGVKVPAALYRNLRRVALVAATFRLGPGLLRWLLEQPTDPQVTLPNFVALPQDGTNNTLVYATFAGWDWLRRAIDIRDNVLTDPEQLTVLLDQFFAANPPPDWKSKFLGLLAAAADWDVNALTAFETVEPIEVVDLKRIEAVEAFASVLRISAQLGVDPLTARTWADDAPVSVPIAAAIRAAAQAKFKGANWASIAQPIRNRLREKQRDALVAYLMKAENIKDREDLFGVLLMDVDLAPCNKTTRLLFATAALQLFMQRALMGLIPNVKLTPADSDEWSWMKRYRVWEANRKLFLYPENWVQPELRDDITPLFERFTAELAQTGIDEASIEKAYIHYLEGLHEVSHLDVSGMYHETEGTNPLTVDRMHVFARSPADPTELFYRRREDDAYWTPWRSCPSPSRTRVSYPSCPIDA
ncbi:neuraminidase-like domain-containing protein [Nannocystis pusilla]|uniref:Neuraminidase-like domain-containing protein n=1 Tax=Nannocystis pusilla TaxID=889268 RepID=A0A9X3EZ59_9BACT|nr:neuraminidase-like domain-containing protein [Nannocystis pusilla]